MKNKTYCILRHCPFTDCDKHLSNAPKGMQTLTELHKVCRRYIKYIVDSMVIKEEQDD